MRYKIRKKKKSSTNIDSKLIPMCHQLFLIYPSVDIRYISIKNVFQLSVNVRIINQIRNDKKRMYDLDYDETSNKRFFYQNILVFNTSSSSHRCLSLPNIYIEFITLLKNE
jgi:hypothetical protein